MFLNYRNISSKIKRSKVTDYAALIFAVYIAIEYVLILLSIELINHKQERSDSPKSLNRIY